MDSQAAAMGSQLMKTCKNKWQYDFLQEARVRDTL